MADAYESTPSTGRHRGGRLDIHVTTSVRAQEAVDPGSLRRKKWPASPEPASAAAKPAGAGEAKPADEAAKDRPGVQGSTTPHGSPATASPPEKPKKGGPASKKRS